MSITHDRKIGTCPKYMTVSDFKILKLLLFSDKLNMKLVAAESTEKSVRFIKGNPTENDPEAYDLNIDTERKQVTVTANTAAGIFYGVQSFISLAQGNDNRLVKMTIKDRPRYTFDFLFSNINIFKHFFHWKNITADAVQYS